MPHVTTNDGIRLHYVEKGSGAPLVMIPGWSQTAAQFEAQVEGLSASRRVIAFDMRGHGESDKPEHGYKIQRLAMDLRNAIEALGLERVSLLGHSMGCSVIWCYIDLFGEAGAGAARPRRPDAEHCRARRVVRAGEAGRRRDFRRREPLRDHRRPRREGGRGDHEGFHRQHVHRGLSGGAGGRGSSSRTARCLAATRPRCCSITRRRTGAT